MPAGHHTVKSGTNALFQIVDIRFGRIVDVQFQGNVCLIGVFGSVVSAEQFAPTRQGPNTLLDNLGPNPAQPIEKLPT